MKEVRYRRTEKKEIKPPMNPGISLLIVVFLVLCLFTFSAISLTTSMNERKQTSSLGIYTTSYYEASNQAERDLFEIGRSVANSGGWTIEGPMDISYDINESQALEVRLEPLTAPINGKYYNVVKWQVVQKEIWQAESTLNLYVPES